MSAEEIRALCNLAAKLIKIEERDKLLGNLVKSGIGVREVEEFVRHDEDKLRNFQKSNYKKRREIVCMMMKSRRGITSEGEIKLGKPGTA